MRVRHRRTDSIENSRQPSEIRHHSNPYSEAMGPIVKEGFVADRIQRLQRAQSNLGHSSQSSTPKIPPPISERVHEYGLSPSPELNPVVGRRVHRTRSFGPVTPEKPISHLASHSFSEKPWIKSSPSTPVIRSPTGAALYWDRKIQSLRHPPTREALEIRRLRRGQRSHENVKQIMSQEPETPSRHQKNKPDPGERDDYSVGREEQEGQNLVDSKPPQEDEDFQSKAPSKNPSTANDMDDMIHHINRALQGRCDSSADLTPGVQALDSPKLADESYGKSTTSPRRRLFSESPSTDGLSLSDIRSASHGEPPNSNVSVTNSGIASSGHQLGPGMSDGDSQGSTGGITGTVLPESSSGRGWYPTDSISSPDRPQAGHPNPVEAVRQPLMPHRILSLSYIPAPTVTTKPEESLKESEPVRAEVNERHGSILEEPGSVQPIVTDRHHSTPDGSAPLSRQPSGTNRKASASSIRSTSSQSSKKWRWWKLALVDKQPKGQEPRRRKSTPHLHEIDSQASKRGEDENGSTTPHPAVETILETEAEREHASIDEVLDGSPASRRSVPHSPSLVRIQTQRSSQWVADLPLPGSTLSASASPSCRGSELRASAGQEAKKQYQRIKKVQVIVSLDGASDLVVETSLERKRRKSWSGD